MPTCPDGTSLLLGRGLLLAGLGPAEERLLHRRLRLRLWLRLRLVAAAGRRRLRLQAETAGEAGEARGGETAGREAEDWARI